jgi:hypothetical protein
MRCLVFDPSGNFFEGKGNTGWAFYHDGNLTSVGQLRAVEATTQLEYWQMHISLIDAIKPDVLVCEDYKLYANTAKAQIGSAFETPQLIGVLKYALRERAIRLVLYPALNKARYTNDILVRNKVVTRDGNNRYYATGIPITNHILDAIRLGEFFKQYGKEEKLNGT